MGSPSAVLVLDSLNTVNAVLYRLLLATIRNEKATAIRDREIAALHKTHSPAIDKSASDIALYESQIEAYCVAHPECFPEGQKFLQLPNGLIGMRSSPPSLQPLNDKWSWEKVEAKLRELWKAKYFHKPKPGAPDKAKIKNSLDEAQLKECGLKLASDEVFYLELNRLAAPDEMLLEQAA